MSQIRNILITGAAGMMGKAFIKTLEPFYNCLKVSRQNQNNTEHTWFSFDLANDKNINFLIDINPEVIIHCAAAIPLLGLNQFDIYQINRTIDSNILKLASKTKSRLIYLSSTIVYGYESDDLNIDETHPVIIKSEYARQKIEAEKAILDEIELPLILRINAPYSEEIKNQTVITTFIDRALQNVSLSYHGTGRRKQDFTNAHDIARMVLNYLREESNSKGVYNISSGNPITMFDLAHLVKSLVKNCKSEIISSGQIDPQEGYLASYSCKKAEKELDWNPKINLQEGIKDVINKRKENENRNNI